MPVPVVHILLLCFELALGAVGTNPLRLRATIAAIAGFPTSPIARRPELIQRLRRLELDLLCDPSTLHLPPSFDPSRHSDVQPPRPVAWHDAYMQRTGPADSVMSRWQQPNDSCEHPSHMISNHAVNIVRQPREKCVVIEIRMSLIEMSDINAISGTAFVDLVLCAMWPQVVAAEPPTGCECVPGWRPRLFILNRHGQMYQSVMVDEVENCVHQYHVRFTGQINVRDWDLRSASAIASRHSLQAVQLS